MAYANVEVKPAYVVRFFRIDCALLDTSGYTLENFASLATSNATHRTAEHGGVGPIAFRRLFRDGDFATPIEFVDVTIIYPGSTIGRHEHVGNEEIYFILGGSPRVIVSGNERRLARGDVTVVRSGQWHELINDTTEDVTIGVVQVRATK